MGVSNYNYKFSPVYWVKKNCPFCEVYRQYSEHKQRKWLRKHRIYEWVGNNSGMYRVHQKYMCCTSIVTENIKMEG